MIIPMTKMKKMMMTTMIMCIPVRQTHPAQVHPVHSPTNLAQEQQNVQFPAVAIISQKAVTQIAALHTPTNAEIATATLTATLCTACPVSLVLWAEATIAQVPAQAQATSVTSAEIKHIQNTAAIITVPIVLLS